MPQLDASVLPKKGNRIRLLLREGLWLYGEIHDVSPSMTFFSIKVLGVKEGTDDEVGPPTRLVDPKDPMGPVEEQQRRRRPDIGASNSRAVPNRAGDSGTPSPALEIGDEFPMPAEKLGKEDLF